MTTFDPAADRPREPFQPSADPDVFFEVSGSAPGLASVLSAAQPGATIVPLGIQKGDVPVPLGQWMSMDFANLAKLWNEEPVAKLVVAVKEAGPRLGPVPVGCRPGV